MTDTPITLRTTLENGLTVLITESHRAPVASFWIWYRVGARNEVPGITGISHWVEHMLFKGTPTWQVGEIFRTINKHGGMLNGFTWIDYTAYFETLPTSEILLALEIESDRLQNTIVDPQEVQSERRVILSEREGNENQPTFYLREEVNAAAFKAHPYGQGVIGFTSDLKQITRDDLYAHYRRYYVPNNATIVVVGDVDAQVMLAEIEERFGKIPRADDPPVVRTVEPPQQGERRITVRRPAPAPTLLAAWHSPEASHPDTPAMVVLDTVLSGAKSFGFGGGGGMGRSSRLYRALVAAGLASSAGSSFSLTIDPYLLSVSATLVPDTSPSEVEDIVFNEVERLRTELVPAAELARAIKQIRAQLAYSGESVAGQGYWLGSLQMVRPNSDPDEFLDQITSVTPEQVRRVAQIYLNENQRTIGWLEPMETSGDLTEASEVAAARPAYLSDGPSDSPAPSSPQLNLRERMLTNQIRLIGHYDPTSEAAVIEMRIRAGSVTDGSMPGLARFTGQMLNRGTRTHTFAELNEELDDLGASIGVSVGREYVDVYGKSLKEDVGRLVELMASVILEPVFPLDEVERVRAQSRTALKQTLNDSGAVAGEALREMVYPEGHPYRHRSLGTEESLSQIQRDDLVRFHSRLYSPAGAIVATAGGVPVDEAGRIIQHAFEGWQAPEQQPELERSAVDPPAEQIRRIERLPGKTQADILLGLPTLTRTDADYEPLRMANLILGRLGLMGRLGASVRERQGMAYHASSSLSAGLIPGLWIASAGVNPSNIERAIDSIIAEVERIRVEPVSDDELADAKSFLIGSLPLGLETSEAIAGTALDLAFYDLGLDYIERLPGVLVDLSADDIQRVAAKYILPERLAIAVARPVEDDWHGGQHDDQLGTTGAE